MRKILLDILLLLFLVAFVSVVVASQWEYRLTWKGSQKYWIIFFLGIFVVLGYIRFLK